MKHLTKLQNHLYHSTRRVNVMFVDYIAYLRIDPYYDDPSAGLSITVAAWLLHAAAEEYSTGINSDPSNLAS